MNIIQASAIYNKGGVPASFDTDTQAEYSGYLTSIDSVIQSLLLHIAETHERLNSFCKSLSTRLHEDDFVRSNGGVT